MLRMRIVGYVLAIRSERQLRSERQVNMAYRWFCGLSLESTIPDHSVFSRARHERFREGVIFAVRSSVWSALASWREWSAARPSRAMPA